MPDDQEDEKELFKPDDVYRIPHIEHMELSPAYVVKCLVPYLSKDETRPALSFINITEKALQATDGKRFISVDREKIWVPIPDGAYRPVKDGKDYLLIAHTEQLGLPKVDALVPESWVHELEVKAYDSDGHSDIASLLYRLARWGTCISSKFAEDIPRGDYKVRLGGTKTQVVIFVGKFTVGIAPLQVLEGA